jgi:hypothetical protein
MIAVAGFLLKLVRRRRFPQSSEERLAPHGPVLCTVLFGSYAILAYRISIFQSRYLVPLAMYYSLAFLICWFQLPSLFGFVFETIRRQYPGPRWRFFFSAAYWTSQSGAVLLLVCVGAAQLYAFASAPRALATTFVRHVVEESPQVHVGLVSYPRRSAFRRGYPDVENRLDEFVTMLAPADESVNSWPKYLGLIQGFFATKRPEIIVMEDVIMDWPVFLPKNERSDYSRRFSYPNPGHEEWRRRLEAIGYRLDRVIRGPESRDLFGRCLETLIGRSYLGVTEVRGGNIYVYRLVTDSFPAADVLERGSPCRGTIPAGSE